MNVDHLSPMARLAAIAEELPLTQRNELRALLNGWTNNASRAQREKYIDRVQISVDQQTYITRAKNVTSSGIFIESSRSVNLGAYVQLVLTFISTPNPIRIAGTVVRNTNDGFAIKFNEESQSQVNLLNSIVSQHSAIIRQHD